MGKTEGIFLNLQWNCHIVGSITIKLINHRTMRDFTTSAVCISWPQEGRSYRAWKPLPVDI